MKDVAAYTKSLDCVHCGLCLQVCPTYDVLGLETDSPRGRIYLMRALAEGTIEDARAIRIHLDQCLGCRACETACPSGVQYGQLLELVRGEMESRPDQRSRGIGAWIRRTFLRHVLAHQPRVRLLFALGRLSAITRLVHVGRALRLLPATMAEMATRIPATAQRRPLYGSHEPDGPVRGRVTLFTGCVMEQMFGDVHRATLRVLLANGFAVDVPRDQVCCGALLAHDGQTDDARALAERNVRAFRSGDAADAQPIVLNSAGCGAAMRDYGHLLGTPEAAAVGARVQDVCEFLADQGLTATPAPMPARVAYDDPCHLCHGQGVRAQPRALLAEVPQLELVSHHDPESCCGSAGIYNLTQPELAEAIGRTKVEALLAAEPDAIATGNPGCMLQIRSRLRALGKDLPVLHPVELLVPEEPR